METLILQHAAMGKNNDEIVRSLPGVSLKMVKRAIANFQGEKGGLPTRYALVLALQDTLTPEQREALRCEAEKAFSVLSGIEKEELIAVLERLCTDDGRLTLAQYAEQELGGRAPQLLRQKIRQLLMRMGVNATFIELGLARGIALWLAMTRPPVLVVEERQGGQTIGDLC